VHKKIAREKVKLPTRPHKGRCNDQASLRGMKFVKELHQARGAGAAQGGSKATIIAL
jgi:hypothetical protein